jgi:hypothetical protein
MGLVRPRLQPESKKPKTNARTTEGTLDLNGQTNLTGLTRHYIAVRRLQAPDAARARVTDFRINRRLRPQLSGWHEQKGRP